jgi:polyisoprenyl-phosphate glycosyltransferase
MLTDKPTLSVVAPVYNEEETLPEFCRRLYKTMTETGKSWEVVFVNDGSKDRSSQIIESYPSGNGQIQILEFSRNFGHQSAVTAGIDHAKGSAIIILDSDLQDPPEIIPKMIKRWEEGIDIIYAVRKKRKESWLKKLSYYLFYRLLKLLSDTDIPMDSGDFCLMDKAVAEQLRRLKEYRRFIRGLRAWVGFRQEPLEYERDGRFAGAEKYSLIKLLRLAFDGLLSFSYLPLRLAILTGVIVMAAGFAEAVYIIYLRFFSSQSVTGIAGLSVIILILGGMILLFLGLIGEYIGRLYDEVKGRPNYIVRHVIQIEGQKVDG